MTETGWAPLLIALLACAGAHSPLRAQTARAAGAPRIRIVVFQFTTAPGDSALRPLASGVARTLVQALVRDPAFRVMSNPRAERDPSGRTAGGNAQYAVIGLVSESKGAIRIDTRLVDVERVQLVVRETHSFDPSDAAAANLAGAQLASWVHERLVPPSP